jgi:copper resistance protein B
MSRRCRAAAPRIAAVAILAGLSAVSRAQMASNDASAAAPFGAPLGEQTLLFHAELDQFEERLDAGDYDSRWDGEAWVGTDANRLWLKSEGYVAEGRTRDGQNQALYDRPLSTYFDLQAGVRYDLDSSAGRAWGALGLEGLAPYNVKVSATAYASDAAHYALKLTGAYEMLLTQRLILEPQVELNGYTRPDAPMQIRSGWSQFDSGLRLRYEIRRKFAPYVGAVYSHPTVTGGIDPFQWQLVAGIRLWY